LRTTVMAMPQTNILRGVGADLAARRVHVAGEDRRALRRPHAWRPANGSWRERVAGADGYGAQPERAVVRRPRKPVAPRAPRR